MPQISAVVSIQLAAAVIDDEYPRLRPRNCLRVLADGASRIERKCNERMSSSGQYSFEVGVLDA